MPYQDIYVTASSKILHPTVVNISWRISEENVLQRHADSGCFVLIPLMLIEQRDKKSKTFADNIVTAPEGTKNAGSCFCLQQTDFPKP